MEKLFQQALFRLSVHIVEFQFLSRRVWEGLFANAQTILKLWLLGFAMTAVKVFAPVVSMFLMLKVENCISALSAMKSGTA
jgi:hypothetical protein